jgi:pimeloyl-ACP methyl ester carboxylesterase
VAGYVNEQIALASPAPPVPRAADGRWAVVIGEHDTLHDPGDVRAYWRKALPGAGFVEAEGAGRLLALADPERVARILAGIAPR